MSLWLKQVKTKSTICSLERARARLLSLQQQQPKETPRNDGDVTRVLAVELTGDRFLRRMVRILVATVFQQALHEECCGRNCWIHQLLSKRDRRLAAKLAPPNGLVFVGADM